MLLLFLAAGCVVGACFGLVGLVAPSLAVLLLLSTLVLLLWRLPALPTWGRSVLIFIGCSIAFSSYSAWRVEQLAAPWLPAEHQNQRHWLTGQVVQVARGDGYQHLKLQHVQLYGDAYQTTLPKVHLSLAGSRVAELNIGDWVATSAKLNVPEAAAFPGAYNPRKRALYEQEGARGLVMGPLYTTEPAADVQQGLQPLLWVNKLRQHIADKLNYTENDAHAVAVALLVGHRSAIGDDVKQAYRNTGLAHLLAISGLHLGLVAGLLFFVVRWLWAWFPHLAQRINGRYPAAIIAWFGAGGYMLLAGMSVPTVRAFIMLSLLFLAMLMNRFRFGVRVVLLAVILLLLLSPWLVASVSFQLSVAATLALVLWVGAQNPPPASKVMVVKVMDYWRLLLGTSVVASLATLPFVALHFNQIALSGIALNAVAIPLTSFLVMPSGLLTLMLMPLGLAELPHSLMLLATGWLNSVAMWGADWPLSGIAVPPLLALWLACGSVTVAVLFLWGRVRLGLVAVMSILLSTALLLHVPDIRPRLVWLDDGKLLLVRTENNQYWLPQQPQSYQQKRMLSGWLRRYAAVEASQTTRCDGVGCVVAQGKQRYLVLHPQQTATVEDCQQNIAIIGENALCPQKNVRVPTARYAAYWGYGYWQLFGD